jgi:hypothetical protein
MSVKRVSLGAGCARAIVQPERLGLPELHVMREVLADFAPEWTAELDGICADEARLVVVPENGDDATGPSFVISRENFGYRVDQVHWDAMRDVGLFASLGDVIAAVRRILTVDNAHDPRLAPTLH